MNQTRRQPPSSQSNIGLSFVNNAAASATTADCLLADQIRLLIQAACAARQGAAQMTLSDWRDVEQEMKQKLKKEKHNTKQRHPENPYYENTGN